MKKDKVQQVLNTMPEDVDLGALIERLYLLQKIEIAEQQLAAGEGIPHDEAKKQLRAVARDHG